MSGLVKCFSDRQLAIPMRTDCAPLLVDLFLCFSENEV